MVITVTLFGRAWAYLCTKKQHRTMKTSIEFRINAIAAVIFLAIMIIFSENEKPTEDYFATHDFEFSTYRQSESDMLTNALYDQMYAMEDATQMELGDSRLALNN